MKAIILLVLLTMCSTVQAAVFNIAPGDENGLITAINQANVNGESDVINLSPGQYDLTSASDSDPDWGSTGLPPIAQGTKLTINGPSLNLAGVPSVLIERAFRAEKFRILLNKGNLTLNRILLREGKSSYRGAGIANTETGKLQLSYCFVSSNEATDPGIDGASGGGIYNEGRVYISKSTIELNTASFGGAIYNAGDLKLNSSLVAENGADVSGGGILSSQTFEATNSTFAYNDAGSRGGGILVQDNTAARLNHTTVAYNQLDSPDGDGAGIFTLNGSIKIKNTIIAENKVLGTNDNCYGSLISEGYNLISVKNDNCGFIGGNGDIVGSEADPVSADLEGLHIHDEYNGAPRTVGLYASSPAIDAIPRQFCAALDQRGFVRPLAIEPSRTPCDIGAHEQGAKPACLGVLTPFVATIVGTAEDDTLVGTAGVDVIHGLGGNDTISGLESGDFICGGVGNDTLNGDDGTDVLFGGEGDDVVNGGSGQDVFWGGTYETGSNELNGQGGNDTINGGIGDDKMNGGAGRQDRCNGGPEINADTQTDCEIVKNVP